MWQQWQLLSLMLDSWPMLSKCSHEIRQAVSAVRYLARPFVADEGDEAEDEAKDRADLVSRAMRGMVPDPASDEKGFSGTVYDMCDAMLNGLSMSELMWWERGGEMLPRASAWVHPRHFTFGNDGRLAVFDEMYNRLNWATAYRPGLPPDNNKFLISQFRSRSGSSLGTGLMRPLAWDWSAVIFNREWMLGQAQRFGNPFLDLAYKPGTPQVDIDKLNTFAQNAGSQGWMTHVDTATVQIHPAQSLGTDNPQVHMMRLADEHCMELLLGQSATTKATPGKLGNEGEKDKVKQAMVQGVAGFVAEVLSNQLARAVLRVNYGDDELCPTIEADFTEEADPVAQAQRDQVFLQAKVPMNMEEFYRRHNMQVPEEGDIVIVGGQVGAMGPTDEEISVNAPPPPEPVPQPGGFHVPPGVPGAPHGQPGVGKGATGGQPKGLKADLAAATDAELAEVGLLLGKAAGARHANGELKAARAKLRVLRKRRGGRG